MSARDLSECPKCGLEAKTLLHRFCTHADCPVRAPREPAPHPPSREADEGLTQAARDYLATMKNPPRAAPPPPADDRVAKLEAYLARFRAILQDEAPRFAQDIFSKLDATEEAALLALGGDHEG